MANATHKMGGDNVLTNTLGILFTDGTLQTTAAVAPPTPPAPLVYQTARVDMGTIASATPSLVTSYTWPTPFADNNYTIAGSVVILETPPAGAATAIVCIGSIELQDGGVGINFVVCNADGVPHHVVAQFIAIHD